MKRYIRCSNTGKVWSFREFDTYMRNLFETLTGLEATSWNYSSSEGSYGYIARLAIDETEEYSTAIENYISNLRYPSEFSDITYEWKYDHANSHSICVISMNRSKEAEKREYDRFLKSLY